MNGRIVPDTGTVSCFKPNIVQRVQVYLKEFWY